MPNLSELSNAVVNLERSQSASMKRRVEMLNRHMTPDEIEEELKAIREESGQPPVDGM
jgi:hypothetical protein